MGGALGGEGESEGFSRAHREAAVNFEKCWNWLSVISVCCNKESRFQESAQKLLRILKSSRKPLLASSLAGK